MLPDFSETHKLIWRIIHLSEMLSLISIMIFSGKGLLPLNNTMTGNIYKLITAGLVFSFFGDLINSYLIDLSFIFKTQNILSALPFSIAHILYIRSNFLISNYPDISPSSFLSSKKLKVLTLAIWPFLTVLLWKILVSGTAPVFIKYLSLAYAFMVCLMALSSIWVLNSVGNKGIIVFLGGLIFLCSDSIFGYFLLDGPNAPFLAAQAIWLTYFTAQLFIAHSPFVMAEISADARGK
jgi:hypothetical protein